MVALHVISDNCLAPVPERLATLDLQSQKLIRIGVVPRTPKENIHIYIKFWTISYYFKPIRKEKGDIMFKKKEGPIL